MISQIRRSKFLIADFTGHRGGVYFEAGYAMGLGLPVFWTCRRDDLDKLHFGIRSEVQCPPWVKSCGLAVGPSLLVYPYQQTFSDADGMSERCQYCCRALVRSRAGASPNDATGQTRTTGRPCDLRSIACSPHIALPAIDLVHL
jgi:hypothetical protein